MRWGYKYTVAMISTLHSDKIKNVMKRGQSKQKAFFVLKLQQTYLRCQTSWYKMHLVEGLKMNRWYMKLVCRLLNVTVLK